MRNTLAHLVMTSCYLVLSSRSANAAEFWAYTTAWLSYLLTSEIAARLAAKLFSHITKWRNRIAARREPGA
jgi:hypothetical protein